MKRPNHPFWGNSAYYLPSQHHGYSPSSSFEPEILESSVFTQKFTSIGLIKRPKSKEVNKKPRQSGQGF